jgi:hypothetical protein
MPLTTPEICEVLVTETKWDEKGVGCAHCYLMW